MSADPSKSARSRILEVVPFVKGFHFFKDIGIYTGVTVISLTEFEEKLRTVDASSIVFHFKRQDFQKWIEDTLGDVELAGRLNQIEADLPGEKLRKEILNIVQKRLSELKS